MLRYDYISAAFDVTFVSYHGRDVRLSTYYFHHASRRRPPICARAASLAPAQLRDALRPIFALFGASWLTRLITVRRAFDDWWL